MIRVAVMRRIVFVNENHVFDLLGDVVVLLGLWSLEDTPID